MRSGFTLIELSIVLVVIGLIVGGVVAGQSMIRSARVVSVISDVGKFQQAIKDFNDRYSALPGDMPNATAQWGPETGCPGVAYNAAPHTITCNGNGDGQIGATSGTYYELFRAWQQLSDAGMIKGEFSGMAGQGNSGYEAFPGVNVPKSQIAGGGYSLFNSIAGIPGSNWAMTGHVLVLGAAWSNDVTRTALLSPEEAHLLDNKMDDGLPGYGKMTAQQVNSCVSDLSDPTASRYIAGNTIGCTAVYNLGF